MKLLIASDIHGSASMTRALLARFEEEGADRLLLLGDILYHGPRNDLPDEYNPKQVASLLNAYADRILCVRGNCEAEVDQMLLSFPVLAEYAIIDTGDGSVFYASHGHHADTLLPFLHGQNVIFLQGHTHVPSWNVTDGVQVCNPGSVSIPKNDSFKSYILYVSGRMYWKELLSGNVYHEKYI